MKPLWEQTQTVYLFVEKIFIANGAICTKCEPVVLFYTLFIVKYTHRLFSFWCINKLMIFKKCWVSIYIKKCNNLAKVNATGDYPDTVLWTFGMAWLLSLQYISNLFKDSVMLFSKLKFFWKKTKQNYIPVADTFNCNVSTCSWRQEFQLYGLLARLLKKFQAIKVMAYVQ